MKKPTQFFLLDRIICGIYLLYQLRLPVRFLSDPQETQLMMTVTVLLIIILVPVLMTIPFLLSRKWGAYVFILLQINTIFANRMTNQQPGLAQIVAILLIVYAILRLTGKVGPPLIVKGKGKIPHE